MPEKGHSSYWFEMPHGGGMESNVMKKKIATVFCLLTIQACIIFYAGIDRGYRDYMIQMQEYYAEYTDIKPYWDVCTVEYPQIAGMNPEVEESVNEMLYKTAMAKVDYWHLEPNEDVERLQEEYHVFASTVDADVTFHSQYLLSVGYAEIYAPINPIHYVNQTMRTLNVDLVTGEIYQLADIIQLNEDFINTWSGKSVTDYGDTFADEETKEIFLDWFLQADEEMQDYYFLEPFFYVTEDREFVIGISIDPTIYGFGGGRPISNNFETLWTAEELESFRTDSVFWERFDASEDAGEVIEYEDLHSNIWLGEDAGVWDYWERWQ